MSRTPMALSRILFLFDNRRDANWGSQATSAELFNLIAKRFPDAEIQAYDRFAFAKPRWIRSLGRRWAPFGPVSNWKDPRGLLATTLLMGPLKAIERWPELIIVNGEGTLHPQPQTDIWLPMIDRIRRLSGARLWIANCSVQLKKPEKNALFDAVLKPAERISLREPVSFDLCVSRRWNAVQGADAAFLAEPAPQDRVTTILKSRSIERPFAIVTGAATARNWNDEHVRSWIKALKERGLKILFAASTPTDRALHERVAPDAPLLTEKDATYQELLAIVGASSFHLGGRYHPTIFAAMSGTPFVALTSNTHKMEGVMRLMGIEGLLFSPDRHQEILDAIASADLDSRIAIDLEAMRELARRHVD